MMPVIELVIESRKSAPSARINGLGAILDFTAL
jgi:hypothetical protein